MENNKKQQNFSRPFNSKNSQTVDSKHKTDLQTTKYAHQRSAKRREQQIPAIRIEQQRGPKQPQAKQRTNVDKRPRARGGGVANVGNMYGNGSEVGGIVNDAVSITSTGLVESNLDDLVGIENDGVVNDNLYSNERHMQTLHMSAKRTNLNHLLNFQYAPRERLDHFGSGVYGVFGSGGTGGAGKKCQQHKYNKEQFLQANFQFVIKSNVKTNLITSPDYIIDWALIEQINIQTTEEPRCPICLYPPVAAKLTKCGHAYCWPCILHYLALNDKTWRKCPICYEAIHVNDLKSTAILQQNTLSLGDQVTFQLMRRKKGSFFVEKFVSSKSIFVEHYPQYSGSDDLKPFSKFLLAKRCDILDIIERERAELLADEDTSCPEYVFVQQALNLLNERREQLGISNMQSKEEVSEREDFLCAEKLKIEKHVDTHLINEEEKILDKVYVTTDDDSEHGPIPSVGSHLNCTTEGAANTTQQKYYFFYQSIDGQNIFLHPLNVKMLQACYGSLEFAPLTINACILQKEFHSMDEELRRKFTCLSHLPLTCQFAVVEVDLQAPIVNRDTLLLFKEDVKQRQLDRERRDREERKREKKIAAINDRQMGKLISKAANLNLTSALEFPVCGFGFDLSPPTTISGNNFTALAIADTLAMDSVISNGAGTPPGPSYSSVITSQGTMKQNSTDFFPELSLGAKVKKMNSNVSKTAKGGTTHTEFRDREYQLDAADAPARNLRTTFGDVMEKAIACKKTNAGTPVNGATSNINNNGKAGKKQKREKKKMVPLFPENSGKTPNLN